MRRRIGQLRLIWEDPDRRDYPLDVQVVALAKVAIPILWKPASKYQRIRVGKRQA